MKGKSIRDSLKSDMKRGLKNLKKKSDDETVKGLKKYAKKYGLNKNEADNLAKKLWPSLSKKQQNRVSQLMDDPQVRRNLENGNLADVAKKMMPNMSVADLKRLNNLMKSIKK